MKHPSPSPSHLPAGAARLPAVLALIGLAACGDDLMGLQPGQPIGEARTALDPVAGEGAWRQDGGDWIYEAPGGVPARVVLHEKEGRVAGFRLIFDDGALRAAGQAPPTFRLRLEKKQVPRVGHGFFQHGDAKLWLGPEFVYAAEREGDGWSASRYDRAAYGADVETCEGIERVIAPLRDGTRTHLGDDGERLERRDDAVRPLRLLAAVADLTCPASSAVQVTVGDFLEATGEYNQAREHYREALRLDADWQDRRPGEAHAGLGAIAARYRRFDEARQAFAVAARSDAPDAQKALWARRFADRLYAARQYGHAAKAYGEWFDLADAPAPADAVRVRARLVRSWLEVEKGCAPAREALEAGRDADGAGERATAELRAAEAFLILACEPARKRGAYDLLAEAVKLDPLMAAEWARLTAYYDREANDEAVLQIMVEQGWLDPRGVRDARTYQRLVREEAR